MTASRPPAVGVLHRWQELMRGSVINRTVRLSGPIDVHIISQEDVSDGGNSRRRLRRHASPLPARRRLAGWSLAVLGVPLLTVLLATLRDSVGVSTVLLLFLALVVSAAVAGGRAPALFAALAGSVAVNWYFTPPLYS